MFLHTNAVRLQVIVVNNVPSMFSKVRGMFTESVPPVSVILHKLCTTSYETWHSYLYFNDYKVLMTAVIFLIMPLFIVTSTTTVAYMKGSRYVW